MKANPGKSHTLLSNKKPEIVSTGDIPLAVSSNKILLGVTINALGIKVWKSNYIIIPKS